jgi:hypothetical protein
MMIKNNKRQKVWRKSQIDRRKIELGLAFSKGKENVRERYLKRKVGQLLNQDKLEYITGISHITHGSSWAAFFS